MKKIVSILCLASLAFFAMAEDEHKHPVKPATSTAGEHSQHGAGTMNAMSHEMHETDAGRAGNITDVSRSINISMDDTMRFTPDHLHVKAGETVRFLVRNNGKLPHEMVIGSIAELTEHATMMSADSNMQHSEANQVTLASGQEGEIIWQFNKAGNFDFACLVPGHLAAGMSGKIDVK